MSATSAAAAATSSPSGHTDLSNRRARPSRSAAVAASVAVAVAGVEDTSMIREEVVEEGEKGKQKKGAAGKRKRAIENEDESNSEADDMAAATAVAAAASSASSAVVAVPKPKKRKPAGSGGAKNKQGAAAAAASASAEGQLDAGADPGDVLDPNFDPLAEDQAPEEDVPLEKRTLLSIMSDTKTGTPSRSAVERRRRKKAEAEQTRKERAAASKLEGEKRDDAADTPAAAEAAAAAAESGSTAPKKSSGIQMRIVNGQMVIAEESLVLAASDAFSGQPDLPFENNRTVTSASYTNRQKCEAWTEAETKLFYKVRIGECPSFRVCECGSLFVLERVQLLTSLSTFLSSCLQSLAQYGTDFSFISQMFPKRTRRQIKSKFKREEKENQYLVDAALRKKIPIGQWG